jgi:adenine-specific DNA-methyltransferase
VIYIDPPYNTEKSKEDGNDYKTEVEASKFIYRDNFTRDGWLNMKSERLKLTQRLLPDTGIIFISIDDSEQVYLSFMLRNIWRR